MFSNEHFNTCKLETVSNVLKCTLKPLLLLDTTWMEKWWIPINWACHHVKKEQISGGHLPKEGKEVASALIKFNQNLELVAEFKHNPLPALASQAVHFVFWGSMFFAAFCIEPTNFDVIGWRGFLLVRSITSIIWISH